MTSKHRPGPWILSETSVLRHGETEHTQICEIFCNRNNKLIAEIPDYCYHSEVLSRIRRMPGSFLLLLSY